MTLSLLRLPLRTISALLLAILFAQAIPSQPIGVERNRGAVFSAATIEVTLPPREEKYVAASTALAPDAEKNVPEQFVARPLLSAQTEPEDHEWPANRQTGPPSKPPSRSLPAPREPPTPA